MAEAEPVAAVAAVVVAAAAAATEDRVLLLPAPAPRRRRRGDVRKEEPKLDCLHHGNFLRASSHVSIPAGVGRVDRGVTGPRTASSDSLPSPVSDAVTVGERHSSCCHLLFLSAG